MSPRHSVAWMAVLGVMTLGSAETSAQTVDFSGRWTLDVEASELPQGRGRGGGRFGGGGGGGGGRGGGGRGGSAGGGSPTVVVTQSATELAVEQNGQRGSRTVVYLLDGSESVSDSRMGTMTTVSRWEGDTLVTEGSQEVSTPRGELTIGLTERRSLSDDGATMTVAATRDTPRGTIETTLVYRRAE